MSDPVVSPAATIRQLRLARVPCPEPGCTGSFSAVKVYADGRGVTAPCPGCRGRGSVPDPAFDDALDAALLAVGERDRRRIAQLTDALEEICRPQYEIRRDRVDIARAALKAIGADPAAVLADKEDAGA